MINEKKFKKFLKTYAIVVISFCTIVTAVPFIFMLFQFNDVIKQANEQYYEVEEIKIPSITKVLGEERKVNKLKIGKINEKPAKLFTYFSAGKIKEDLQKYIDYLIDKENYEKVAEFEEDTPIRTTYLIKYGENIQKTIEIKVQGKLDRYTIGVKILDKGDKIDVSENWEEDFEGETLEKN